MSNPTTGEGTARDGRPIGHLLNASQLRTDTWSRLKYQTERLARGRPAPEEAAAIRAQVAKELDLLEPVESYWAFPGSDAFRLVRRLLEQEDDSTLHRLVLRIVRSLVSGDYRRHGVPLIVRDERTRDGAGDRLADATEEEETGGVGRPYFELLVVDASPEAEWKRLRDGLRQMRRPEDRFVYEIVQAGSLEDALIAVLFNPTIQAVVIHHGFPGRSRHHLGGLEAHLGRLQQFQLEEDHAQTGSRSLRLARMIGALRPEVDCYLVTDQSVEDVAGTTPPNVRRVFYSREDFLELHLNIQRGINERYKTPFFTALKDYSVQPTGVFHAMPISRGKSITKSHWIQDMAQFYGVNIFLAETSATSGGLDSLLDPQGPIKKAQEKAARAFGAQKSFFVTNGTSTANKIVLQAVIQPGDIVLVDRNCHKSHHYGFVLSGARVSYLDSYPLHEFSMYGAVPLRTIKETLLRYRREGLLDRVKMLLLTNCTFDGVVYHAERVMQECLAIKPDLVFLWDEAWFAFARFDQVYRQRTGMEAAHRLKERFRSEPYRREYEGFRTRLGENADDSKWLDTPLLPDPDRARIRVYATQSTHKTLTSLRQGSMIHVFDQDFAAKTEESFHEAFMTHTSTSPNYQIVASLDVGRRQVELEGYELVQKQTEMAMALRQRVAVHPLLRKHFRFLTVEDMIPEEYRESGLKSYYDRERGWAGMMDAWTRDEFALDPCRLTLFIGETGVDGDTFKNVYLMQRHGIQINKTSRNTVLFMTNIGTTRSSVAYLIEVLVRIAQELEEAHENASAAERALVARKVESLVKDLPPLPDFSRFHEVFRDVAATPDGDIRAAYFLAGDEENCEYLRLDDPALDRRLASGEDLVSAKFVIPYPPGFPILVPGQVVSSEIVEFMRKLDVKEIHGYQPELGLRVFTGAALASVRPASDDSRAARAGR